MRIIKNTHKINAIPSHIPEGNYLAERIGFWALVKSVNALNNTVTVISDTGFEYPNIQVKSDEWVTVNNEKNYIPSQRNLPPENSRVFVLAPTHSITGAFVLCSGFSRGDENIRTLWASNDNELEDKNNCREVKTQGGWDITEEYKNGNFSAKSNDEKLLFNVNTAQDDQKGQNKEVSVTAWDNVITINEDGMSVTDKNGNKIENTNDGIKVTDKNNNIIEATSSGIKVTDKNNNVIEMKSGGASIKVGNSEVNISSSSVKINNHLEVLS